MHYQLVVSVRLKTPIRVPSNGRGAKLVDAHGFIITFGVNADDCIEAVRLGHAAALDCSAIDQPSLDVGFIERIELDAVRFQDWPREIVAQFKTPQSPGIYYRSGVAFYADG